MIKIVNEFKLTVRFVHARGFTAGQKNCGKSGLDRTGLGHRAAGPPGVRAEGPSRAMGRGPLGLRAAGPLGLLLAKPPKNALHNEFYSKTVE